MSSVKRPKGPDTPAPDQREVPDPPSRGYEAMQVFASLTEIQKDVVTLVAKTDRLIIDVGKQEVKVDELRHAVTWAKGFGVAAIILIPLCAAIIWWLVGGKLEQMRDDLVGARRTPATQSVPAPR